jgi:hypothetical protein
MFDKPDPAAETPETLGGFLRGVGLICYCLAVVCIAMAVWDVVELAQLPDFGGSAWVERFFRRPMWTMVLFALLFTINGAGFARLGAWFKARAAGAARRSGVPGPPKA